MARKNRAGRRDPAWEVLRRGLPATRSPETVRRLEELLSFGAGPARELGGEAAASRGCRGVGTREELLLGLVVSGDEASGRRSASGAGSTARRKEESKGAMGGLWLGGSMDW